MPNADQQYWDAVRTGEREEEPWTYGPPALRCGEWQCRGSHEECAKAGECLLLTRGVMGTLKGDE